MKTLSTKQLIELLPAQTRHLDTLDEFEALAPVLCRDRGYCRQLVDAGDTRPEVVLVDGREAALVTWHLSSDRGLWIDIAQTLRRPGEALRSETVVLFEAADVIRRREKAAYTRFLTKRRGLAHLAGRHGFTPEAVLLTKPVL